jgi:hypothetical protein
MELLELAKQRFDDLTDNEVMLFEGIQKEGVVRFLEGQAFKTLDPSKNDLPELRAECLAWLLTDKRAVGRVSHRGVTIHGARLVGELDASFTQFQWQFRLFKCDIPSGVILQDASFGLIRFSGSRVAEFCADGIRVAADMFLDNGFVSNGEVRLLGAVIGGDLTCLGGVFRNEKGTALNADCVQVSGNVFFRDGFTAYGEVRLLGGVVGGSLDCRNGRFLHTGKFSMNANRLAVSGNVLLEGMSVGGRIDFGGGSFQKRLALKNNSWGRDGVLSLGGASAGELSDNAAGWPEKGNLHINGFVYASFNDASSKDLKERFEWLNLQPDDDYRPQPYEQLAEVLERSGYEDRARNVRIEKNRVLSRFHRRDVWPHIRYALSLRRSGASEMSKPRFGLWRGVRHGLLGLVMGFGYKPVRLLVLMLAFVLWGAVLFGYGKNNAAMIASQQNLFSPVAATGEKVEVDGVGRPGGRVPARSLPDGYPRFHPFLYSLDTFLPLVNLEQGNYWMPNSDAGRDVSFWDPHILTVTGFRLRVYLTFHILMGWFLTSMAIAAFAGRLKR